MEVYVSAVENPSQFWVQVIGPGAVALDKLVEEMTAYYNNEDNKELHALKKVRIFSSIHTLSERIFFLIFFYLPR